MKIISSFFLAIVAYMLVLGATIKVSKRSVRASFNVMSSSSIMTSSTADVRVTSYNVLSSQLGGPGYYTSCRPEWLDANYRFNKLTEKLENEIRSSSIICMQELSLEWTGKLHSYFASRNYYLITTQYGNKFNGYMGVGIAYPMSKFVLVEGNIVKIADTKRIVKEAKPQGSVSQLKRKLSGFAKTVVKGLRTLFSLKSPEKVDLWDSVLYRSNQMLNLRFQFRNDHKLEDSKESNDSKSFVVGTYHMPCMFQLPSVMVAHCALSAQQIQRFANSDPFIFAGDFNIKPESSMYGLLTKGFIDKAHVDYPKPPEGDTWNPTLTAPLMSAYKLCNGKEPDFSNYAKVKEEPEFIDTLDYIFLSSVASSSWEVSSVLPLPDRSSVQGPLPNQEEPSDHLMLAATLRLVDNVQQ